MLPSINILGRSPRAGVFSGSPFKPASHFGVSLLFEDIKPASDAPPPPPPPPPPASRFRIGFRARISSRKMADDLNTDTTFAIVKPDALTPFKYQQIDALIKLNEFEITRQKLVWLTEGQATALFPERAAEADGPAWLEYVTSAPCLAMELAKPDAPLFWQLTMGAEDPGDGGARDCDSIRGILAVDRIRNAVDGSQGPEDAARQLQLVFSDAIPALPYDNFLMQRADDTHSTLALLKPDVSGDEQAVARVIGRAVARGYTIKDRVDIALSRAQAAEFYAEHEGKAFFDDLVVFMASGPVIALLLEGDDVIRGWHAMIGPTDAAVARKQAPQSIRALLGTDGCRNAVHGSESPAAAQREVGFFFFPRIRAASESVESTPSTGDRPLSADDKKKKKKQQKKRRNKRKQAVTVNAGAAVGGAAASDDSDDEPVPAAAPEPSALKPEPEPQSAPAVEAATDLVSAAAVGPVVVAAVDAAVGPAQAADAAPVAEMSDAVAESAPVMPGLVHEMEALAVSHASGDLAPVELPSEHAAGSSEGPAPPDVDMAVAEAKHDDDVGNGKQAHSSPPEPAATTTAAPQARGASGEKPSPFGCLLASSPFLKADRQSGQESATPSKRVGRIKSPFLGDEQSSASPAEPAAAETTAAEPAAAETKTDEPAPETADEATDEATHADAEQKPDPQDSRLSEEMAGLCIVPAAQNGHGDEECLLPAELEAPAKQPQPAISAGPKPRAPPANTTTTPVRSAAKTVPTSATATGRTGRPAGSAAQPATASRRATLGPAPTAARIRPTETAPATPGVLTRSAARAAGSTPAQPTPSARPPPASGAVRRTPAVPPRATPAARASATGAVSTTPVSTRLTARAPATPTTPTRARAPVRPAPGAAASQASPQTTPERPAAAAAAGKAPSTTLTPSRRLPPGSTPRGATSNGASTPARVPAPAPAPAAATASPRPVTRSMASRPPVASTASSRARAAAAAAAKVETARPAVQPKAPVPPAKIPPRATAGRAPAAAAPTAASRAKAAASKEQP